MAKRKPEAGPFYVWRRGEAERAECADLAHAKAQARSLIAADRAAVVYIADARSGDAWVAVPRGKAIQLARS